MLSQKSIARFVSVMFVLGGSTFAYTAHATPAEVEPPHVEAPSAAETPEAVEAPEAIERAEVPEVPEVAERPEVPEAPEGHSGGGADR